VARIYVTLAAEGEPPISSSRPTSSSSSASLRRMPSRPCPTPGEARAGRRRRSRA
jgi:hypothetical protein